MSAVHTNFRRAFSALALALTLCSASAFAQSTDAEDAALLKQISRNIARNINYPAVLNNQSLSATIVFTVRLDENSRVKDVSFDSKTIMHEDLLYCFVRSAMEGIQRSDFKGLTGTVELPIRFQRGL